MTGISAQTWRILHWEKGFGATVQFDMHAVNGNKGREYKLIWYNNLDDGRVIRAFRTNRKHWGISGPKTPVPRKMAISMAIACGVFPHGRVYTATERPDLYERPPDH